jgi:hypothetical protein
MIRGWQAFGGRVGMGEVWSPGFSRFGIRMSKRVQSSMSHGVQFAKAAEAGTPNQV